MDYTCAVILINHFKKIVISGIDPPEAPFTYITYLVTANLIDLVAGTG